VPVAYAGQTKTAVHQALSLTRDHDLAARVLVVVDVRLDQVKQGLQFVRVDGGGVEGHVMSL
jgi:IMP dehydrogenase/GMP reductase